MSPHLDEVCKKYGYKTVNVATWRDPSLSVLSGGRGPRSGYKIPAGDVAKPYIPTYKVKYAVPEPTDDEASDGEMTGEDLQDKVDSSLEPEHIDTTTEFSQADKADETQPPLDTGQSEAYDDVQRDEHQDWEPEDQDRTNTFDEPVDEVSPPEAIEAACEDGQEQQDAAVPSATPEAEQALSPPTGSEGLKNDHDTSEAIQADFEEANPSKEEVPLADEEHAEDKKVAFAPGTPEPRPTHRKKKSSKSSKGKKKRTAAPVSEASANEQALDNTTTEEIPPPPPDPPSVVDDEPPTSTDDQVHDEVENQQTTTDTLAAKNDDPPAQVIPAETAEVPNGEVLQDQDNVEEASKDLSEDRTPQETQPENRPEGEGSLSAAPSVAPPLGAVLPAPPPADDEPQAPPSIDTKTLKKSGKKLSKKKLSKSKSNEVSSPPSGLGIDVAGDHASDAGAGADATGSTPPEPDVTPAAADLPSEEVDTVPTDIAGMDTAVQANDPPASESGHAGPSSGQSNGPNETLGLDEESGTRGDAEVVAAPLEPPSTHGSDEAELASEEPASPVDSGIAVRKDTDGPDDTLPIDEDAERHDQESADGGEDIVGDPNDGGDAEDAADVADVGGSPPGDPPADHLTSDDTGLGDEDEYLGQADRDEKGEATPDSIDDLATERSVQQDDEEDVALAEEPTTTCEEPGAWDDSASDHPDVPTLDEESVVEPKSDDETEQDVASDADSTNTEKLTSAERDSPQDASEAHDLTPEEHRSDDDNDAGVSGTTEQAKDTTTVEGDSNLLHEEAEPESDALWETAAAEDTADAALADDGPLDDASTGRDPASASTADAALPGEAPADKASANEVPADESPGNEAADGENLPPEETPEEALAADGAPNGDEKAAETAADRIPALEADSAIEEAPTEENPSGEAAEQAGPADETPVDDAPNAAAPADAAPTTEPTPEDGAPEAAVAEASDAANDETLEEAQDEAAAAEEQPAAPASPVLSKTSSHESRKSSTHWDRPHRTNKLKDVLEAPVALKRPHGHRSGSKDEVVHRERKHRRHRSSTEEKARHERKRLEERKAEAVRALEEEKKRMEADERRRARRAARKEEEARLAREEARKVAEQDAERRRRRRHEREMRELERREKELREELAERKKKAGDGKGSPKAVRKPRTSSSTTTSSRPARGKVFSGESVHRTGFLRGDDGTSSRHSREMPPRSPRLERSKTSPASVAESSRRSRRREGEGEGRRARREESGERTRKQRPTVEEKEKPRGFLSSLFRRS